MKTSFRIPVFALLIILAILISGFAPVQAAPASAALPVSAPDLETPPDSFLYSTEDLRPAESQLFDEAAASDGWSSLGTGANNWVNAVAVSSGHDVYVGGTFTSAGSCNSSAGCNHIAKWNGSTWSPLGTGTNDEVDVIVVSGSTVYAGGKFTSAGTCTSTAGCNHIAKWNGSTWSALGSGTNDWVNTISLSGSNIYAGGAFTSAGTCNSSSGCNRIAKWNGSTWSPLGTGTNNWVFSIAINGSNIYAGGTFTSAGTCTGSAGCNRIAKWDGSSWSALGTGTNNWVYTIAISGSDVYAGGTFTSAGTCTSTAGCNRIAKWNGSTWSPLGAGINNWVYDIAFNGTTMYAGGTFTSAGTCTSSAGCNHIAKWNGSTWSPMGAGMNNNVLGISLDIDRLYAVGTFTSAGSCNSTAGCNRIATYFPPDIVKTYNSTGSLDGWILESSETSGVGGSMNSTATTFQLGDDAANRQYRVILSFDTSSLPDNAAIQSATLKIQQSGAPTGTNPFNVLGTLKASIRRGYFAGSSALQLDDFIAAPSYPSVGSFSKIPASGWYSAMLDGHGQIYINITGVTQFRLFFSLDDNNNHIADYMKFLSGNSASGKPQLIVKYKVP